MQPGEQFRGTLFHGARQRIDDTHVRPPSMTGADSYASRGYKHDSGQSHTESAFATPYEHVAQGYASQNDGILPPLARGDHPMNNDPDPKYRSRVYTVAPAADQVGRPNDTEIGSRTGFEITGEHNIHPGKTGTFSEINWNAYKSKRMSSGTNLTSAMDANHDDEHYDHARAAPPVQHSVREGGDEYGNRKRVDERHDDQLNLFSGKTVAEHKAYERTAGMLLHPGQFDTGAFHRDPTVSTIRAAKDYHKVDTQFGTVR